MTLVNRPEYAITGEVTQPEDLWELVTAINTITDSPSTFAGAKTFSSLVTFTTGIDQTPLARTATSDGLTTGIIPAGTNKVAVTSANANNIIVLPAPVVGHQVTLYGDASTGWELRSSTTASIGINGGTSAAAESAIAAATTVWCECTSLTNWTCWSRIANGTLSVVQVAAD